MSTQTQSEAASAVKAGRTPMPRMFCNLDRLFYAMEQRNIDGMMISSALNVFYLSGFSGVAHKSDEPRPYAIIISRHLPDKAIMIVADYYLSTVLMQPSWIEDVRTFRAVMMPLDLPPHESDIDRFVPAQATLSTAEIRARHSEGFAGACQRALVDLKLDGAVVAADDLRFGHQMSTPDTTIVDGYDPMMFAGSHPTQRGRHKGHYCELAARSSVACLQPAVPTGSHPPRRLCTRSRRYGLGTSAR